MKPKNIQTQAQSRGHRKIGDAPTIGRVARIPEDSVAKKIHRRRSSSSSSTRSSSSGHRGTPWMDKKKMRQIQARRFAIRVWITLILFVCLSVFVGGMILWLRSQADRESIASRHETATSRQRLEVFTPPSERDAVQIVQNAMAARDAETIRMFIHDTREADVDAMLAFFSESAARDGEVIQYQWIGTADVGRMQIQSVNVIFEKNYQRNVRTAMLVPDESGVWRLDFPFFSRWCDPPIRLIDHEAGYPGGRVRVLVVRDLYFNGPFSDDREWACYAFISPDSENSGFAYCRIGSQEHAEMQDLLNSRQGAATRVTLEIRRAEGAEQRQFELTRIVTDDWMAEDWSEPDGVDDGTD